jgi:hypothetical protein
MRYRTTAKETKTMSETKTVDITADQAVGFLAAQVKRLQAQLETVEAELAEANQKLAVLEVRAACTCFQRGGNPTHRRGWHP